MDLVPYVASVQTFFTNHPSAAAAGGFAAGVASGNLLSLAVGCFKLAMKFPPFRLYIASNPAKTKALIDAIEQALDKEIDEAVKENNAPPPPPVAPAP